MVSVMSLRTPEQRDLNVAILFDADNTPHGSVKNILDAMAIYGRPTIKRAYGDWTTRILSKWRLVFSELSIKPVQQFSYIPRKNVTDSAMIIDAMDLLHSGKIDVFALVSSDSDFTGLATRIREEGLKVVGIGRRLTPPAFINACDKFLLIENLVGEEDREDTARIAKVASGSTRVRGKVVPSDDKDRGPFRDLLIRAVRIMVAEDEDRPITGSRLGTTLLRQNPDFHPKNYGCGKLANLIDLHPGVLKHINPPRTGTDSIYESQLTDEPTSSSKKDKI